MAVLALDPGLTYNLVIGLGLWMAWSVGANDFANAAGPAIGAKFLRVREAIIIVVVFELCGALFHGTNATGNLAGGIIDLGHSSATRATLILGMLASLVAASSWVSLATLNGWPVSTTHSMIGALLGFGLVAFGSPGVHWANVGGVLIAWILSPLAGGLIAFCLMKSIGWLILHRKDPARSARRWSPLYVFLSAFVVFLMTFFKGMKPLGIELSDQQYLLLAGGFGLGLTVMGTLIIHGRRPQDVEGTFAPMTLFTLCSMAFVHGANDVANAADPVAVVLQALGSGRGGPAGGPPLWLFALTGVGIALGCATLGPRVARTMGELITALTPSRAFCVSLAGTATVVLATRSGIPVSTTQAVVGAIVGVGLCGGTGAVGLTLVRSILGAWLVTLPITAALAAILFLLLRTLLSG